MFAPDTKYYTDDYQLMVNWPRNEPLASEVLFKKMLKNSHKVIDAHIARKTTGVDTSQYSLLPTLEAAQQSLQTLGCAFGAARDKGRRPAMNDADFCIMPAMAPGWLGGVFDGSVGNNVSQYASRKFQELFFSKLSEYYWNVHRTFEEVIHQIHLEVAAKPEWRYEGSTAVITYLDVRTHLVYTATLGNAQAWIYRKVGETMIRMPLSAVRDWSSKQDARRADYVMTFVDQCDNPREARRAQDYADGGWVNHPKPESLRMPFEGCGTIYSRAFGAVWLPAVSHKPKITVHQAQPGDVLILGPDGFNAFVKYKEIIQTIEEKKELTEDELAQALVSKSLVVQNERHNDNVTVVVARIK